MRQFKVEGEWCLDEHGMRVGRVITEYGCVSAETAMKQNRFPTIMHIEFLDDRFVQSGGKLLAKMNHEQVGTIDLGP